jgi:NAD(P)-dependent dehydrogenase (short-subunit alcohol dehydrogenase family)
MLVLTPLNAISPGRTDTGSSRGFGRRLAEAVLEGDDQLVATARTPEAVSDLQQRYPDRARPVALDVTDPAAARRAVQAAVDSFGRLDVLVNNAGYANVGPIEDVPEEDFRAQIETNLWGVINVTRAALPIMREQRSGHIIQFSSLGGPSSCGRQCAGGSRRGRLRRRTRRDVRAITNSAT